MAKNQAHACDVDWICVCTETWSVPAANGFWSTQT